MLNPVFQLHLSKQYLIFLGIISMLSLLIVVTLPLQLSLKCVSVILLSLYILFIFWRDGFLKSKQAIISLHKQTDGSWLVQTRTACYQQTQLRGDSTVTRWVSVLRFQVVGRRFPLSCIIFRDSLTANQEASVSSNVYRQLLLNVKFG